MYSYFKRRGKVDTSGFHHIFKSTKEESHLPSKAESPGLPSRAYCMQDRSLQTPLPKQTKYYQFQFFKVDTLLYCFDIQRIRIFLTTRSSFQKKYLLEILSQDSNILNLHCLGMLFHLLPVTEMVFHQAGLRCSCVRLVPRHELKP